jgi:succinate dehydrogenase / fumarate reductase, cytochrome b subunit
MGASSGAGTRAETGVGTEPRGQGARLRGSRRWRVPQRGDHIDYRPRRFLALWRSTIGKKYVVAITGLIFAIFVVLHMLGNLKALEGPGGGHPAVDAYARFLRRLGSPALPHNFALWIERIVLLGALMLHVVAITQLWLRNRRAKPREGRGRRIRSTLSARTMTISGATILAFVVFHILHFTTRTIHPTRLVHGAVYANAYGAFHRWWLVVIYVGAVVLLGLHINHGLWSGAQTAGVDNPDRNWFWRRMASFVTVFTVIGFAVVPILLAFDVLPKPSAVRAVARAEKAATPAAFSARAVASR